MLTTVAALIIVLGLMASLARYVRNDLAVKMTKDLLHKLDSLVQQYDARHGHMPHVVPFVAPTLREGQLPDEQKLAEQAVANNRSLVQALRADGLLGEESFGKLPQSVYSNDLLRDAWGSPIVFMESVREGIGMAPGGKPFFFSAGPDQKYLSMQDNLYSYEK